MNSDLINILLVEDNLGDVDLLQIILSEVKSFEHKLTITNTLNSALEHLNQIQFDVTLLDLSLPDAQGLDTVSQMRRQAMKIPIVVLTGLDDETLALKAVQKGAQDYIIKGAFDGNLLVRTIRHAIERHRLLNDLEKQMQAYLSSETRFHNMIEYNADGVIIIDQTNIVRFVNPATETLFNRSSNDLIGQPFEYSITAGEVKEVKIQRLGDNEAFAEIRVVDITWDEQPAYLATLRDVTQRKRTEQELTAYREQLEILIQKRTALLEEALEDIVNAHSKINAILHSVADGLIVIDPNYQVILANSAAETIFNFEHQKMLGQEIDLDHRHIWLRHLVESTSKHRINDCELEVKLEDNDTGQLTILQARAGLVDNQEGELLGIVIIIRDVTRLREVDRLKSEFLTMAAHELRTPLTTVLGFSEILVQRQISEGQKQRYIAMINEQAIHLNEIVNNLLDIARLEAGRGLELDLKPVDINSVIDMTVNSFIESSKKHKICLELGDNLPQAMVDTLRVKQVGKNLLSNAIKYSPNGGTIKVRSRVKSDWLELSVQDEGIGLTPEQQAHLFEQFYRADTSNTAIGGTGLGLTISKLIVNLHGGDIWVKSRPDKGTTVSLTLPIVKNGSSRTNELETRS